MGIDATNYMPLTTLFASTGSVGLISHPSVTALHIHQILQYTHAIHAPIISASAHVVFGSAALTSTLDTSHPIVITGINITTILRTLALSSSHLLGRVLAAKRTWIPIIMRQNHVSVSRAASCVRSSSHPSGKNHRIFSIFGDRITPNRVERRGSERKRVSLRIREYRPKASTKRPRKRHERALTSVKICMVFQSRNTISQTLV